MYQSYVKGFLFCTLFLLLCIPMLQNKLHFFSEGQLDGDVHNAPEVHISKDGWMNGTYQEGKANYLNDEMGLRAQLVRLNNQIDFSLLRKVHANNVVVGPDNYLYERGYIDRYCGVNYPGDKDTRICLLKLKKIQDTLEHLGKHFVFIHAPSKAWYYPNNFPIEIQCHPTRTVYKDCLRLEDSIGIHYLNFNAMFLKMKDTTKNLLFSKQGTHWTSYGAYLAQDTLIRYLEQVFNTPLPRLIIDKINYSDTAHKNDIDIARGMNLLYPIAKERFTYPESHFAGEDSLKKINTIYLGDSFFWTFIYTYFPHNFNNDYEFWYYFKEVWYRKEGKDGYSKMSDYNWQQAISETDLFVMMFTEVNLQGLGNGFIEQAYDFYYPGKPL